MARRRVNPRRKPATEADVERAYNDGCYDGGHVVFACVMLSVKDAGLADNDTLVEVWKHTQMLMEQLRDREIKLKEIDAVLAEEYNIYWELDDEKSD